MLQMNMVPGDPQCQITSESKWCVVQGVKWAREIPGWKISTTGILSLVPALLSKDLLVPQVSQASCASLYLNLQS